jgi:hypothetical protein
MTLIQAALRSALVSIETAIASAHRFVSAWRDIRGASSVE